jgi:hypothetical protein
MTLYYYRNILVWISPLKGTGCNPVILKWLPKFRNMMIIPIRRSHHRNMYLFSRGVPPPKQVVQSLRTPGDSIFAAIFYSSAPKLAQNRNVPCRLDRFTHLTIGIQDPILVHFGCTWAAPVHCKSGCFRKLPLFRNTQDLVQVKRHTA